jgi:multiple sugar transport system ATP-binding protein
LDIPGVADGEVVVGLRPEALRPAGDGIPAVRFTVDVVEPLGDEIVVHGSVAGRLAGGEPEEQIPLAGGEPARATITARFDPQLRPKVGDRIPLGISPDAVHVFDPLTGSAIR